MCNAWVHISALHAQQGGREDVCIHHSDLSFSSAQTNCPTREAKGTNNPFKAEGFGGRACTKAGIKLGNAYDIPTTAAVRG